MDDQVIPCTSCGRRNRVPAAASGTPTCAQCHTPLPWIAVADDGSFEDVVTRSRLPVLLDLWAPWCGPCRMVSPALEQLAREHAGGLKLVKVNVDEAPGVAERFAVQGIPTLIVLEGGRVLARQTGAAPESALRSWLESALPASQRRGTSGA